MEGGRKLLNKVLPVSRSTTSSVNNTAKTNSSSAEVRRAPDAITTNRCNTHLFRLAQSRGCELYMATSS
jgi:hypothetical protein